MTQASGDIRSHWYEKIQHHSLQKVKITQSTCWAHTMHQAGGSMSQALSLVMLTIASEQRPAITPILLMKEVRLEQVMVLSEDTR